MMAGVANVEWEPSSSIKVHLAEDAAHRFSVHVQALMHVGSNQQSRDDGDDRIPGGDGRSIAGSWAVNAGAVRNDVITDAALSFFFPSR